eukprot:scaffold158532_cov28-Tisochrysis_lutea.AAC.2
MDRGLNKRDSTRPSIDVPPETARMIPPSAHPNGAPSYEAAGSGRSPLSTPVAEVASADCGDGVERETRVSMAMVLARSSGVAAGGKTLPSLDLWERSSASERCASGLCGGQAPNPDQASQRGASRRSLVPGAAAICSATVASTGVAASNT